MDVKFHLKTDQISWKSNVYKRYANETGFKNKYSSTNQERKSGREDYKVESRGNQQI